MARNNKSKTMPEELDLGQRKVSQMNFSKIVTLPKTFTQNCLGKDMMVSMTMQKDGSLTLRSICKTKKNGGKEE